MHTKNQLFFFANNKQYLFRKKDIMALGKDLWCIFKYLYIIIGLKIHYLKSTIECCTILFKRIEAVQCFCTINKKSLPILL